jgi:transposase
MLSKHFWLTDVQMARMKPFFPMMQGLAAEGSALKTIIIDVCGQAPLVQACPRKYLMAHRTASRLRAKKGGDDQRGRLIGRTKGGLNTKLRAATGAKGRPQTFFMTVGQISDETSAVALVGSLPAGAWMIANRGCDADGFRDALKDNGIRPSIPGRKSRGKAVGYDKRRCRRRNLIEIMFGRLKDWRRVATRYDRCAKTFLSAVARTGRGANPPCMRPFRGSYDRRLPSGANWNARAYCKVSQTGSAT